MHRSLANLFQGGKFLRRKPRLTTSKARFGFQFCHAIQYDEEVVTINVCAKEEKGPSCRQKQPGQWEEASPEMGHWLAKATNGIFKTMA
ncbi:MAG: hypothetical protein WAO13_16415 [Pseudolabrys sp.]